MSDDEQRQVLEDIARDEGAYPRDRIAAIKALREMAEEPDSAFDELDRLLGD